MDQYDAIPDELRERHGFPKDVWESAEVLAALYVEWLGPQVTDSDAEHVLTVSIAKAILAERNRAIEAACGWTSDGEIAEQIAKAIRGGHQ